MKAYKVEVLVLDFENYGKEQIDLMLGDVRGLSCSVQDIKEADIGDWADEHPLNHRGTAKEEFARLFPAPQPAAQPSDDVVLKAKRYDWLRQDAKDRYVAIFIDPDTFDTLTGEELDKAVDGLMAKEKA